MMVKNKLLISLLLLLVVVGGMTYMFNTMKVFGENANKKVKIYIDHDDKSLKIIVIDEGDGFDIKRLPNPTDVDNILDLHGRGVFIARQLVDEFFYQHHEGSGSEFMMIIRKKLIAIIFMQAKIKVLKFLIINYNKKNLKGLY